MSIAEAAHPESTTHTAAKYLVVVSKGQSRNPEKRGLESAIAERAAKLPGVDVLVIPHLYDLPKDSKSFESLREFDGDVLVVSWIFSRATHWVLDRNQVRGRYDSQEPDGDEETEAAAVSDDPSIQRVSELYPRPERRIRCIDLKQTNDAEQALGSIREFVGVAQAEGLPIIGGRLESVDETTKRRWYPVIDFDRCTNCMECIDFCLFGVYGVDGAETILVEQPDNCRKGCPACSRVCPENAIIFPQHKAPAIAGAQVEGDEGFKIDLSQLFGAPAGGGDAIETAARERDEHLLLAGRDAVGIDDQLQRRQQDLNDRKKDEWDDLIDELEASGL